MVEVEITAAVRPGVPTAVQAVGIPGDGVRAQTPDRRGLTVAVGTPVLPIAGHGIRVGRIRAPGAIPDRRIAARGRR